MIVNTSVFLLDSSRTEIVIHTYAEGLLSRLAHDLELVVREVSGHARLGDLSTAEIEVSVPSIQVVGALRDGKVDPSLLSVNHCREIERQLHEEVLVSAHKIRVSVRMEGTQAWLTITVPTGSASFGSSVTVKPNLDNSVIETHGLLEVSLQALGIAPVRGPLGAFRVSDRVTVLFRSVFKAPRPAHWPVKERAHGR